MGDASRVRVIDRRVRLGRADRQPVQGPAVPAQCQGVGPRLCRAACRGQAVAQRGKVIVTIVEVIRQEVEDFGLAARVDSLQRAAHAEMCAPLRVRGN